MVGRGCPSSLGGLQSTQRAANRGRSRELVCQPRATRRATRDSQLTKDPAAAQFQNVSSPNKNIVCGQVNPKNAFGAYDGFRPFVVGGKGSPAILEPGEETEEYYQYHCVRDQSTAEKPNACKGHLGVRRERAAHEADCRR